MTKENIIKLLEHEKSICKKLKKEYRDDSEADELVDSLAELMECYESRKEK